MGFGKCHVARILRRVIVNDDVFGEGDGAALVALLLVPGETPAVSFQAGYHVVEAVAVHDVKADLRTSGTCAGPRPASQLHKMIGPGTFRRALSRLLPPPIRGDDVHASISVD